MGLFKIPSEYAHYELFDLLEPQTDIEKTEIVVIPPKAATPVKSKKTKRPKQKAQKAKD